MAETFRCAASSIAGPHQVIGCFGPDPAHRLYLAVSSPLQSMIPARTSDSRNSSGVILRMSSTMYAHGLSAYLAFSAASAPVVSAVRPDVPDREDVLLVADVDLGAIKGVWNRSESPPRDSRSGPSVRRPPDPAASPRRPAWVRSGSARHNPTNRRRSGGGAGPVEPRPAAGGADGEWTAAGRQTPRIEGRNAPRGAALSSPRPHRRPGYGLRVFWTPALVALAFAARPRRGARSTGTVSGPVRMMPSSSRIRPTAAR
jgi:hypothetical protein